MGYVWLWVLMRVDAISLLLTGLGRGGPTIGGLLQMAVSTTLHMSLGRENGCR